MDEVYLISKILTKEWLVRRRKSQLDDAYPAVGDILVALFECLAVNLLCGIEANRKAEDLTLVERCLSLREQKIVFVLKNQILTTFFLLMDMRWNERKGRSRKVNRDLSRHPIWSFAERNASAWRKMRERRKKQSQSIN